MYNHAFGFTIFVKSPGKLYVKKKTQMFDNRYYVK